MRCACGHPLLGSPKNERRRLGLPAGALRLAACSSPPLSMRTARQACPSWHSMLLQLTNRQLADGTITAVLRQSGLLSPRSWRRKCCSSGISMSRPRPVRPARAVRPRRWMYCSRLDGTPTCGAGRGLGISLKMTDTGTQGKHAGMNKSRAEASASTACSHLQHQRDIRVVDATRRHVGREEDGRGCGAEFGRRLLSRRLQRRRVGLRVRLCTGLPAAAPPTSDEPAGRVCTVSCFEC